MEVLADPAGHCPQVYNSTCLYTAHTFESKLNYILVMTYELILVNSFLT